MMAHLGNVILGNMTKEGGLLYDVKFAEAVRPWPTMAESAQHGGGVAQAKPQGTARAQANAKPKPNPEPTRPVDGYPVGSEP